METLGSTLRRAHMGLPPGTLYMRKDLSWELDTPVRIIDVDSLPPEKLNDNDDPIEAIDQGFVQVLGTDDVEEIVMAARQGGHQPTDEQLLRAFLHYHRWDGFLFPRDLVSEE